MTDQELERLLQVAASGTRYPATPDIADRVATRLAEASSAREAAFRPFALSFVSVVLAAVVLAVALALVASPVGHAVARLFGVEGSKIERLPRVPDATTATPLPAAGDLGASARPVSLAEAAAATGFQPGLPAGRALPREAYLVKYADQAVVVLRYEGFDVWQAQLQQDASFGKIVSPESIILDVRVRDEPAIWLSGGTHFVRYILPSGQAVRDSVRTVDKNTLIWRTSRCFYRLETELSLSEALSIAASLP
jgi:hypothetical protein